jgi:hypothetical protein
MDEKERRYVSFLLSLGIAHPDVYLAKKGRPFLLEECLVCISGFILDESASANFAPRDARFPQLYGVSQQTRANPEFLILHNGKKNLPESAASHRLHPM